VPINGAAGAFLARHVAAEAFLARHASSSRCTGHPTLLQVLAVLQAIFAYAVTMERVSDNPVSRVAKPLW
jgi:hypothetical protein